MKDHDLGRRRLLNAAAGAAAASTLSAPAVWGQGATVAIKLASVTSMSGGFARYGQELQRGIDLAMAQINAKGLEIGGRRHAIEQTVYDDKTEAATSAKLVEKAVTSDKAHMVLAGLGSIVVKASIPVAQRLQFPMMTHWAQIDGVFAGQKGAPFMYGAMAPFSHYYTDICRMAAGFDNPKVKTVAMITPNDELGVFTAKDYLPSDVRKSDLELVAVEMFPPKSQDYAPALERIRRKASDMLVINCYTPDIIGVFKEMQALKYFPAMIVVEAPTKLHESVGDAINGVFAPSFWDPSLDKTKDVWFGSSRDFAGLYQAKHGEAPPDFVAACGANNVVIYVEALKAAGAIDDPKKINAAFRAMNAETFFSAVQFSDDGLNRRGGAYPSQFQGGRPQLVYPADSRTATAVHPYPGFRKA